jgi:hypothetical protein
MDLSLGQLSVRLLSVSDATFYDALAELRYGATYDLNTLEQLVRSLGTTAIPEIRKGQRLRTIIQRLGVSRESMLHLARTAATDSATLRNEFATLLPPADRRLIHDADRAKPEVLVLKGQEPAAYNTERPRFLGHRDGAATTPNNTVLLLGEHGEQEQNRKLLNGSGYGCVPINTREKLAAELNENVDICGIVIDRSFINRLASAEQLAIFRSVAEYSSIAWVRIDGTALKTSFDDVRNVFRSKWATRGPIAAREVSIQTSNLIHEGELGDLQRAASLLREIYDVTFSPREISGEEQRVLVAALREHDEQLKFDGTVHIEIVETRILHSGKSGARVAMVRINRAGRSVVAKFDSKENLLRELTNYRKYVQSVDDRLQPLACFHGSAGVLLSTLISEERVDSEPAQTLLQRLSAFRQRDMTDVVPQDVTNLREALLNTAHAITNLAKSEVSSPEEPRVHLDHLDTLEARGVNWGIAESMVAARHAAVKKFQRFPGRAVTHGDLNLKNILVYGERSVQLIDFAWCGPGHPADDLVRFEVSLFTVFFMPLRDESHYANFQAKLTIEDASADQLISEFAPQDPAINALCIHGCVAARDAALSAVKHHGGGRDDYIAAKLIVAWQHLPFEERQFTLARAIIRALSPHAASARD